MSSSDAAHDATSSDFPPAVLRAITAEVAALLKQRGETVAVAETVRTKQPPLSLAHSSCGRSRS